MTPGQRRSQERKKRARDRKAMEIAAEALRTHSTRAQVVQRRWERVEAIRAESKMQAEARKHTPVVEDRFPRGRILRLFPCQMIGNKPASKTRTTALVKGGFLICAHKYTHPHHKKCRRASYTMSMYLFELFKSKRFWLVVLVAWLVAGGAYYWQNVYDTRNTSFKTPEERDLYVRFEMEAYDSIKINYWKKLEEADLAQLFQLSLAKAGNLPAPPALATNDRAGTAKMLADSFNSATSTEARKQLALNTLIVALYNLAPAGRNSLYTSKEETAMRQEVANVNPEADLYSDLGLARGASVAEVDSAYKEKEAVLAQATTAEAKAELERLTYAHKVLANAENKTRYDEAKIEPTTFARVLGKTLYISMDKISPTTLQEFGTAIDHASTTPDLSSMILDLRGNIGGSLDFPAYFLGLFVGQNQYAFDLYKQGDYEAQRTVIGKFDELSRYKEIAILTDNMTQSTAEVLTAMFKHFNLARVVGTPTRGWGTVENTFPLQNVIDPSEKYTLFLVRYLTLRDDGQPIEGAGVDPDVNTNDKNWREQLDAHFHSQSLINAISQTAGKPPLQ